LANKTVHIVDDDQAVRKSLKLLLASAGFHTREYAGGREFLEHYEPSKPECLLLDLRMPDMDGLAVQRELDELGIDINVVFLSGHGDIPIAVRAVREGALDFVEKPFDKDHLLERLRACITSDIQRQRARLDRQEAAERLARLTAREKEIVDMLVEGKINKVIGGALNISTRTVESHRARIMKKLGAGSLSDVFKLVYAARENDQGEGTGDEVGA